MKKASPAELSPKNFMEKIGYLPKTSPALDHIPKLGSTLVKYLA
jgi:hypothetical protein